MRPVAPFAPLLWVLVACPPSPEPSATTGDQPTSRPSSTSMKGSTPETRDQVDEDGVVRRGDPLESTDVLTVSALIAQAGALDGKRVTVRGEVTEVCAKKGCWMALRAPEGGPSVRVLAKAYNYFVPRGASGMKATVTGDLSVRTLDAATAQHYADDARGDDEPSSEPPPPAPRREITIASVGLELRD